MALRFLVLYCFIFLLSLLFHCSIPIKQPADLLISEESSNHIPYLIYFPDEYYLGKKDLPLLLYIPNLQQKEQAADTIPKGKIFQKISNEKLFPFVLVVPTPIESTGPETTSQLYFLVQEITKKYPIDPKRMYGIGDSKGGSDLWNLAIQYPNLFTAIVPIHSVGDTAKVCKLQKTSVKAIYIESNKPIALEKLTSTIGRLKLCNPNANETILPFETNSIDSIYNDSSIYHWMLSQTKLQNEVITEKKSSFFSELFSSKKDLQLTNDKPKKKFSANTPFKILFIGDSMGIASSMGFTEVVLKDYHIEIQNNAKVSTSLVYPKFFNWPLELQKILSVKNFDLGVVFIGANDPMSMSKEGKVLPFGTEAWKEEYSKRAEEIVDLYLQNNIIVYWLEMPPMGRSPLNEQTRWINSIVRELSEKTKKFHYLSTTPILGDKNGNYTDSVPYKGKKTLMRWDGVHFTFPATYLLRDLIIKQIYSDFEFEE